MIQKISTRSVCPVLQAGTTSRRHGGREQAVEMSAMAAQNKLHFSLSYPSSRFRKETMEQSAANFTAIFA